jgi:hypothetical protein
MEGGGRGMWRMEMRRRRGRWTMDDAVRGGEVERWRGGRGGRGGWV